jgi:hypothetical protein
LRNETATEARRYHFRALHCNPLVRALDAKDKLIAHLHEGHVQARGALGEKHLSFAESVLGQTRSR